MSLIECVKQGDLDGLKRLVEQAQARSESDPLVQSDRHHGRNAIMQTAAHYGHNAIIEYLHSIGVHIDDINCIHNDDIYIPRVRALVLAVIRGSKRLCDGDMDGVSTVKLLLEKGANPNPVPMEIGAPLRNSIGGTDDTTITRELLRYDADVDFIVDENDVKPIVLAAETGRVNQLQLLLEAGADPWRRSFIPGGTEDEEEDYFGTAFDAATGRAKEILEEWQRAYILAKARRVRGAVNKGSQSLEQS